MEIVNISSDSDNSNPLEDTLVYSKPLNIDDDIFVVDWNNDYYSELDHEIEPKKTENTHNGQLTEIESSKISHAKTTAQIARNNSSSESKEILDTSMYDISNCSSPYGNERVSAFTAVSQHQDDVVLKFQGNSNKEAVLTNFTHSQKEKTKLQREQKKLEKEELRKTKRAEQQRQKASKAIFVENQRNLKPEENIKFLKVHIDNEIINSPAGGNLISQLHQNNIQFSVESQLKSFIIFWSKRRSIKELNDYGDITETLECKEEKELVYVLEWNVAINLIHSNELLTHVETIMSIYPRKKLTLILYGLQNYFDFQRRKKKNEGKNKKLTENEKAYNNAPKISIDQLEFALTDLQLFGKHNVRLLETPEELSALIFHMTRSLSQLDYKEDKRKRQEDDFDWFAKGDSSQAVKVDKNGVGLIKLWQQQICQFNSAGLETAQAIIAHYSSPLSLVRKYEECGDDGEGESLLQNIQTRRELGLLSTTRRVGPQLSKKIYKFFTSDHPDEEL